MDHALGTNKLLERFDHVFCITLSFAKSGQGESVGGFLKNSVTSLYLMRLSFFGDRVA
jgi:hypothetical protein